MTDYLAVVPKYMSGHKKKTRLIVISVALAVALVTAVFSMLDFMMQYEKQSVIMETGNFHISIKDPSDAEASALSNRIDVENSGGSISLNNGSLNGRECRLMAIDEQFAADMNVRLIKGAFPVQNEIMLEDWAAGDLKLNVGDTVTLVLDDGNKMQSRISGLFEDFGGTKAQGMPGVLISMQDAVSLKNEKAVYFFARFKDGVNIDGAITDIQNSGIAPEKIGRNEKLLAVMGQSKDTRALQMYGTGAVLFVIVLIAGVLMISNTFNISVMERIRQFGLLRCIGASKSQVKKIVRREGLYVLLRALPIGLVLGMGVGILCSLILKFLVSSYYGDINVLNVSLAGIAAGAAVGALSVFLASSSPAKKASRVSPVNAVTGSNDFSVSKKRKQGWLTRTFRVETALGMNNAFLKKKTFVLMAFSIAISIVMFFGFQVFIDFTYSSMKVTKPYTPDISIMSEQPIPGDLKAKVAAIPGVDNVYGRMFGYVNASFDPSRLTESYRQEIGGVEPTGDGFFIPKEKSWLISYDQNQLDWAKMEDRIAGDFSEKDLNEKGGVIAVASHLRNSITADTCSLKLGDKVRIETPDGVKEMTVMGILLKVPFSSPELCMTSFITTEQNFTALTGKKDYDILDAQLDMAGQEQAVSDIKGMLGSGYSIMDLRQKNAENDQMFFSMAVFVYGFLAVIALISILNIINTMNTSVASKIRYLGMLRAVGISGRQLQKMVWTEAAVYSLTGCVLGCALGILLQKALMDNMLSFYHFEFEFPWLQTVVIFAGIIALAAMSVIGPLKRIRSQGISEVIGSL
jgi:putative ABC transport system permease protein